MKTKWKYVEKDGHPKEMGDYYCLLVAMIERDGEDVIHFEYATRYFADLDVRPDLKPWIMDGEYDSGLAWTEESGSLEGERVYAWHELPECDAVIDMESVREILKGE